MYDAGEIAGIVIASVIGFGIFACCVKFIFCEAVSNKQESRGTRTRRRRRNRPTTSDTTTPTDPEEHFNAHFNTAFTVSDNQEEVFTPPGFPYPPPFPAAQPFGNGELPPAYDVIFSKGGLPVDGAAAAVGGATGGENPIDTGAVNIKSAGAAYGAMAAAAGSQPIPMAYAGSSNPYPPSPSRNTSEQSTHGQPSSSAVSSSFTPVENTNEPSSSSSLPPPYMPVQQNLPYPPANPIPAIPPNPNASQSQAESPVAAADPIGATAQPVRATAEVASASVVQAGASAEPVGATADPDGETVPSSVTENPAAAAMAAEDPADVTASDVPNSAGVSVDNNYNEENCDSDA